MDTLKRKIYSVKNIWLILVLVCATISFSFVDHYFEISKNLEIFTTIYKELVTSYIDDVEPGKLMETGIDAMLKSLDPYTSYITESEIEDYRFQTTGKYGGIGARIKQAKDKIIIVEPYKDSPAHKGGLMAGDIILKIDNETIHGKNTDEVSELLKGAANTQVELTINRPPENTEMTITIIRGEINVRSVPYFGMINENVGYIKLTTFTQFAGRIVHEAMASLSQDTALKAVIIDLRYNQGGLLDEAINVSNVFINKGEKIVSTIGKQKDQEKVYKTLNDAVDTDIPLVILTNDNSASASEIVAGAVQDLDRGLIVGTRTFGKGLVQTTKTIAYNTRLKLTIAKYYIPSGRCIQAIDYIKEREHSKTGKIPDSLKTAFKTKNGRIVYDGDGIQPDLEVEPQTLKMISQSLLNEDMIFDFATLYRSKNNEILPAKEFEITDEIYSEFMEFLADKEYDYTTASEKLLKELEEKSQSEEYYKAIEKDLEILNTKILHDKNNDLIKFKDEISNLLKMEIAARYYLNDGRTEASFKNDQEIQKAIELLQDLDKYSAKLQKNNDN